MANIIQHLQNNEFERVLNFCNETLKQTPNDHQLIIIKAWCLYRLGELEQANTYFLQWPNASELHPIPLGLLQDFFFITDNHEQMIALCQHYLQKQPTNTTLWYKLALSQGLLGLENEAIITFKKLLSLESHNKAKVNLACLLFNQENFTEGLALYESRFDAFNHSDWILDKFSSVPLWQGEPLNNKTIVIWAEQGLGDTIQFSRFATVLAQQGAQVHLLLHSQHNSCWELMNTIEGVTQVYRVGEQPFRIPDIHYHCPMMGILKRIHFTNASIPSATPYLRAITAHESQWAFIQQSTQPKIGLVWSTKTKVDGHKEKQALGTGQSSKNIPLHYYETIITQLKHMTFYSLQYDISDDDAQQLKQWGVINTSKHINNFSDTAAIIEHMDLIISIDTSVTHLAGAMAKPTITLLPTINDWRWQENRNDSPWYPTMTLIRQHKRNDWSEAMAELQQQIEEKLPSHKK